MKRKIRGGFKVKCEECKYFNKDGFCGYLKHELENGYAMDYHSDHCGVKVRGWGTK